MTIIVKEKKKIIRVIMIYSKHTALNIILETIYEKTVYFGIFNVTGLK